MPRLSALVAERTIPVKVGDSTIEVTYDEAITTSAWLTRLQTSDDEAYKALALAITDWDITDDDDELWPIDPDSIAGLPFAVFVPIVREMGEDVMGKKGSGGGSSRKAKRARARSGTPESEPEDT